MYDIYIGHMSTMKFLRLNVNDDSNYGMGGADIADQIADIIALITGYVITSGGIHILVDIPSLNGQYVKMLLQIT